MLNTFYQDVAQEISKENISPTSGLTMEEADEKIKIIIHDTLLDAWRDIQNLI